MERMRHGGRRWGWQGDEGYKCKWGHGFSIAQSCSHRASLQALRAKSRLTLYVMLQRWSAELCSESNPPLFNKTAANL